MSAAPLKRRRPRDPAKLPFVGELTLLRGRIHEFCGSSRVTGAMLLARATTGPILWIGPSYGREALNPDGARAFIDPGRLVFAMPEHPLDVLWAMEEALRSGTISLVIADLTAPPELTPVRRMTLAAEAGTAVSGHPPLGLILTPGDGGAAGIETRWHLSPRHHGEVRAWHLERRRARLEPQKSWALCADGQEFSLSPTKIKTE